MTHDGFIKTASGSGLLVPEDLARESETWMPDRIKRIKRLARELAADGVAVELRCTDTRCADSPLLQDATDSLGRALVRCPHKDRRIWK